MKTSTARWIVSGIALLGITLVVPAIAPAQTTTEPIQTQSTPAPDAAQPPDSVQAQPDSVQAQPAPAPTTTPAAGVAPAAGAAGTTTTTPQSAAPQTAAPSTTPPPAQTAPPPATAPAAQSATTPPPAAQSTAPQGRKEPFTKGTTRVSITGGWGRSFDEDYLMLGDPGVFKISPNVGYVLAGRARRTKPYVGAFWRRTMIEDADDLSSVGGRAGAYFKGAGPVMIGGGAVWENYLDCEEKGYESCSQVYPEFLISASF